MIYLVSQQSYLFDTDLFKIIHLEAAIEMLRPLDIISVDTETEGLDVFTKRLLLLQLGNGDFQILFDINSYNGFIPAKLADFLHYSNRIHIFQNAKFDLKFLMKQNIIIKNIYDTMLAEIILTNGLQYSGRDLASIVMKYCGVYLDKSVRGDIIKFGLSNSVLQYAADDIKYLEEVREKQLIEAAKLTITKAIELDCSFVLPLAYTEFCGIKLDYNKWSKRTAQSKVEILKLKKELEAQLLKDQKYNYFSGMMDMFTNEPDCILNWDSPKQVLKLFKEYGIKTSIKDKGVDKETIDAKVLKPQEKKFPILVPYLKYKEKQKEVSTYGEGWKKHINSFTGRIHTTYQQLMDTSRLSSGNKRDGTPNLQNIPADKETRSCFIPEPGNVLIDADYSSQEQVVLANFSKEDNLLNFYAKGFKDMHSYVTFLMYPEIRRCEISDLTPEALLYIPKEHEDKRKLAKNAGFAINYGGNGSTIAKNCNIPVRDGEFVYKSYFEAFPKLKDYFDLVFNKAAHYGYIQFNSITKRKYFFNQNENGYFLFKEYVEEPDFWRSEPNAREYFKKYNSAKNDIQRLAQNYPIQGTSSDITKYACILFFGKILEKNWLHLVKIVNLIHDEILVECPAEMVEEVKEVLVSSMERAGKPFCTIVPLKASAVHGDYWVH